MERKKPTIGSGCDDEQKDEEAADERAALVDDKTTRRRRRSSGKAVVVVVDPNGDGGEKGDAMRKKSLSWKNDTASKESKQDDITAETSLLYDHDHDDDDESRRRAADRVTVTDYALRSIINHLSYFSRSKQSDRGSPSSPLGTTEASTAAVRRAQIERILNVTYATACLGILLCLAEVGRIFGPYGLLGATTRRTSSGSWRSFAEDQPEPWTWIIYQTVCRLIELLMACAMASVTRQSPAPSRDGKRDSLYDI